MIKNYKSSASRLVHYFKDSKEKWKKRALLYQKEKRKLKLEIRDLRESRQNWKNKCKALKGEVDELRSKQKKTKDLLKQALNL